jgi:hypothetical protein
MNFRKATTGNPILFAHFAKGMGDGDHRCTLMNEGAAGVSKKSHAGDDRGIPPFHPAPRRGEFLRRDVSCCPSLKAERDCVGGSGGHFSKNARNGAPRVVSVDVQKTNPRYTSPLKWPARLNQNLDLVANVLRQQRKIFTLLQTSHSLFCATPIINLT